MSINRAGTLALVANRSEGTVSVFSIAGNMLTRSARSTLGNEKSGPSHVAFTPDGKTALVTRDGDHEFRCWRSTEPRSSTPSGTFRRGSGRTAGDPSERRDRRLGEHGAGGVMQIPSVSSISRPSRPASFDTDHGRPNAGRNRVVPRRRLCRRERDERVEQAQEQPVLQRLRSGEGIERQGWRTGSADRSQGRPLVSGLAWSKGNRP